MRALAPPPVIHACRHWALDRGDKLDAESGTLNEHAIHGRSSCYLRNRSPYAPAALGAWVGRTVAGTEIPMWVSVAALVIGWRFSNRALA
jgi:hypothetical protein